MVRKHQAGRVLGLTLFLLINFVLIIIFVNLRDNADTVLEFRNPALPDFLTLTIIYGIALFTLQILFNWLAAYRTIKNEHTIKFYPELPSEEQSNVSQWGKYNPQQIANILLKTAEKANVEIKEAYLETAVIPKVDSYNFRGRRIFINSNLLQICGEKELEAAFAVEIGYTSYTSSFITYLSHNFNAFVGILYALPFFFILRAILLTWVNSGNYIFGLDRVVLQLFYLVALVIFTLILRSFHKMFINWANTQVQYVADHLAVVKFVGKRVMINMLVKVGQRTEALDVLLEEIRWLEGLEKGKIYSFDEQRLIDILLLFPADELSEDEARKLAPNIFIQSRLKSLVNYYYFELPDLEDRVEHSAKILRMKRNQFLEEQKKISEAAGQTVKDEDETIDWRHADVDGNLDLDDAEIEVFINSLKDNPEKLLFENELLKNALFKRRLPANKQILFVYDLKI